MNEKALGERGIAADSRWDQRIQRLDETGMAVDQQCMCLDGLQGQQHDERDGKENRDGERYRRHNPGDTPRGTKRILAVTAPALRVAVIGIEGVPELLVHLKSLRRALAEIRPRERRPL